MKLMNRSNVARANGAEFRFENHLLLATLVVVAVLSRLIPHPPNFTAIGAMGLFSVLNFRDSKVLKLLAAPAALFLSDAVLGFHNLMAFTYFATFAATFLCDQILKENSSKSFLLGSVLSATVFFVLSNLGVWLQGYLYPSTWTGFVNCFSMALPFYKNDLFGCVFYGSLFQGTLYLYQRLNLIPQKIKH